MGRERVYVVLVGLLVAVAVMGCGPRTGANSLPPERVYELHDDRDVTVVDVREPGAYEDGHIPGAINIPFDDLEANLDEIPESERVIFVCQAGPLSRRALDTVREHGFQNVNNMDGGMSAWREAGYELEP